MHEGTDWDSAMEAAQGNDRLMMLNFLSPIAISVAEKGNLAVSAPGMRQPGGPTAGSKRPAALMDGERLQQSAKAKSRAAMKAATKLKDGAASSGGPGGGRQPKPKDIMAQQPGGGKGGGKDNDRAAGPDFSDSAIRQTNYCRSVCASFNKGTCTFAKCKFAHFVGSASRQPTQARIIPSDGDLRRRPVPIFRDPNCLLRRYCRPDLLSHRFLPQFPVTWGWTMISNCFAILGFPKQLRARGPARGYGRSANYIADRKRRLARGHGSSASVVQ